MNKVKILLTIIFILIITGCNQKDIIINENKNYDVNSNLKISDLIKSKDNISITNNDEKINTSKLGEKEVIIRYNKNKKEKYYSFKINIVDQIKPVIDCNDTLIVKAGQKDILDQIKVIDNSRETIKPIIEGNYDLNKPGEYNLIIKAKDSTGNIAEKNITLIVKSIEIKKNGYYVYKTKDTWHEFTFTNNSIRYLPWFCPKQACGGYEVGGTYKINNDKITATMTYSIDDIGEKNKLDEKMTLIIIDENTLEMDGHKYLWQKDYEG